MKSAKRIPALVACTVAVSAALVACLLEMSYGYYMVVRLATAVAAGCWAYVFFKADKKPMAVTAGAVALLFQPFVKIPMDRATWAVIDVAVAVLACLACLWHLKKQ